MTESMKAFEKLPSKTHRTTMGMAMDIASFNIQTRVWSNDTGVDFVTQVNDGKIDSETVDDWFTKVMKEKAEYDEVIRKVFGS